MPSSPHSRDEKGVGNLDEDAGAVAGFGVAAGGAAMGEVDEDLEALADDLVALFAADVRDQSHAAGIVLIARMIEALRCGGGDGDSIDSMAAFSSRNFALRRA